MTKANLFGPFFGESSWEFYRFAPYAIYLKKVEPDTRMIVLTRSSRFDFYGKYADILVPLNIPNDHNHKQIAFKLIGFDEGMVKNISDLFMSKYNEKFEISNHYIPDTSILRFNLKWQFPRSRMDYNFSPRLYNSALINRVYPETNMVILDEKINYSNTNYTIVTIEDFNKKITNLIDDKSSYFGCLIELIKKAKFTISNISSDVGRLSLLLKTPLIYQNREATLDSISLLNPLKTKVIDCDKIEDGVQFYENNF